jgi:signal transduction histidine kinase
VVLATRVTADRVAVDVRDQCGGLPAGRAERWFQPFSRGDSDRSGLGLGLAIARRAVHANLGELSVENLPGEGCIFTIDLPRSRPRPASESRVDARR